MTRRRSLARLVRRLSRPSLGRLVVASVALHVAALTLPLWLWRPAWAPQAPPPASLIVELPPAAPGTPLVRPEAPAPPSPGRTSPPVVAARPTPPVPPPAVVPPVARPPEPPAVPPVAAPPSPPEPVLEPGAPPAPRPGPALTAKPPEPEAAQPVPAPPSPAESPFAGRRFSLLGPRIEVPPVPGAAPSGSGGTRPEGSGGGESGLEVDGQVAIPLNTPDPRYAEYFLGIKKRIEAHWVYPQDAVRRNESGQGVVEFVLKKDGTVRLVEIIRSSGVAVLDRYVVNAIRFAAPFQPIPDRIGADPIPISLNFSYVLHSGVHIFGFR